MGRKPPEYRAAALADDDAGDGGGSGGGCGGAGLLLRCPSPSFFPLTILYPLLTTSRLVWAKYVFSKIVNVDGSRAGSFRVRRSRVRNPLR